MAANTNILADYSEFHVGFGCLFLRPSSLLSIRIALYRRQVEWLDGEFSATQAECPVVLRGAVPAATVMQHW